MMNYQEEIDLRPYLRAIFKFWWFILMFIGVMAVSAGFFSRYQPDQYSSRATILVVRSRPALTLAEQFPTVSEPVDARSRMDAISSIADSDSLALMVLNELSSEFPEERRSLETIKNLVDISSNGDLLIIEARANTPDLAAKIANTWAAHAVEQVNLAYSGDQPLPEYNKQLERALEEYQIAQRNLQDFLKENQISFLENRVLEAQTYLSEATNSRTARIIYYETRIRTMETLKVEANALMSQILSGNSSAAGDFGDALATLIARASALGVTTTLTIDLQMNEVNSLLDSSRNYAADLEALIEKLDKEKSTATDILDQLTAELVSEQGYENSHAISEKLAEYQARLEEQTARSLELTSKRDVAWQAYQALVQKKTEIENASQTYSQVVLASQAIPPQKANASSTIRNTIVAGLLGLVISSLILIGRQWWQMGASDKVNEPDTKE
jgi:uncharacterized protein involved in exopolysaccharide biosynthesis